MNKYPLSPLDFPLPKTKNNHPDRTLFFFFFLQLLGDNYVQGFGGQFSPRKRCRDLWKDYRLQTQTDGQPSPRSHWGLCSLDGTSLPLGIQSSHQHDGDVNDIYIAELSQGSNSWSSSSLPGTWVPSKNLYLMPPPFSPSAWPPRESRGQLGTSDASTPHGGCMTSFPLKFSLGHVIQEIISSFYNLGLN